MKNIRYTLKPLPYDYSDLSPVISKEIMTLHHDKHHQSYVDGTNKALELLEQSREGVDINIKAVLRDLSFNLNGHILHDIFWSNMKPYTKENNPPKELEDIIIKNFNSFDNFKTEFINTGKTVEGSGWVVMYKDIDGNLLISQIQNHNLLNISTFTPILVNDVWEHAYYLDYMNDRGTYLENWFNVVNWDNILERINS
jgi:Fe-Mn family superoxide dismutase